jgi:S-adenosylmethionine hydrolase
MCTLATHYQAVRAGRAVAVPGSSGYLEIAVNGGDARAMLGLGARDRVEVRPVTFRSVAGRVRGGRKGK